MTSVEEKALIVVDVATQQVVSTVSLERQPGAIAWDAASGTLWVANYNDASVTLLDAAGSALATVAVGQGPMGVAVDPGLGRAYVTNSLDKTVSVIDTKSRKVLKTRKLAYAATAAAVDPVQHRLCLVNPPAMSLLYCYDETGRLVGAVGPSGDTVAIDEVTHSRYSTKAKSRMLSVVDGVTSEQVQIPVGQTPSGVTVDPTSHLVYVGDHDTKTILVINASG